MLDKFTSSDNNLDSSDHVVEGDARGAGLDLKQHETLADSVDNVVDNVVQNRSSGLLAANICPKGTNNSKVGSGVASATGLAIGLSALGRSGRGGGYGCL